MLGPVLVVAILLSPDAGRPLPPELPFRVVVHKANPVSSLTQAQLSAIFMRRVRNWPDGTEIRPVDHRAGAPVRERFSRRSGLQLLEELKREQPDLPVLVLTMHGDDEYAVRAVRGGASAYVTKESAPEELITALRKVMSGGRYMTPALAEKVAFAYASPGGTEKPHQSLSERELEILRLIGAGRSLKEIAAMLELSVKSIGTYRSRVLEKMSMNTNADLIRYVIENQLSL